VKLICSGAKGVESLLSLRTAEPIRLAFLVCSPHPIEQRDVVASKGSAANLSEMEKSSAPAVTAAPARELCLAIVDTQSVLTVYSVQLKILFSSPLCNLSPSRLSPQTFSMSSDGRVAFLPSATFLVEAQLFPAKCYSCTAPPARLLRPVETSIDSIEAAAVAANAPPASGGGGWFSALIPTVSHATLFDTQMYKPPEEVEHALAPFKSSAGSDDSVASSAPDRTSTGSSTSSSRLAASSSSASSDSSSSSSVDPKIRSAQKEISSAKSQMQMNNQIAANNLRKTEEIQDKAEMMASHAGDFLAAARKLKQQQKDSWW
jgi:hypothetical protein